MTNSISILRQTAHISFFLIFAWSATAQWAAGSKGSIPQGAMVAGYQEPSPDRGEGLGAPYQNYQVEPNPLVITVQAGIVSKQNFNIK